MGRRLRIFEPGAYYHVTARGNNGEAIVRDDLDCLDFFRWFSPIAFAERWRVVSYCLIREYWLSDDLLDLLYQLGAIPAS